MILSKFTPISRPSQLDQEDQSIAYVGYLIPRDMVLYLVLTFFRLLF